LSDLNSIPGWCEYDAYSLPTIDQFV
jgi:hypothetical protein